MSETPRKPTQDAEDRALEALIVQRLRGDGELPELSEKEVAAMNSLGSDFIARLIADEPKTPEVFITLTESQFRAVVCSAFEEGYIEGHISGLDSSGSGDREKEAKKYFQESCGRDAVNKLIELEKQK